MGKGDWKKITDVVEMRDFFQDKYRSKFAFFSPDIIEEFGSFCVEKWLSGKRRLHTPFSYMAGDYQREYLKDPRSTDALNKETCDIEDYSKVLVEPDNPIARMEAFQVLNHESIKPKDRELLILLFEKDYTPNQIAKIYKITRMTAYKRIQDATKRIREALSNPSSSNDTHA